MKRCWAFQSPITIMWPRLRRPTPKVARAFGIEEGTPVQREENTTYLEDGRVMDFTVQFYNPTRYRLEYYRKR